MSTQRRAQRSGLGRGSLAFGVLTLFVLSAVSASGSTPRKHEDAQRKPSAYFSVDTLNEGLPSPSEPPDLSTPRAALVNFFLASRNADFERAARSLNLEGQPHDPHIAAMLAGQLYYVVTQRVEVDFSKVPDRPDGAIEELPGESDIDVPDSLMGQPRRSIKIGAVPLRLGDVEIRLERFKPRTADPVWLFSPRTVQKISDMYERHGPGPLFEHLPFPLRHGLLVDHIGWRWVFLLSMSVAAAIAGWLIAKLVRVLMRRLGPAAAPAEAQRMASPTGVFAALLTFYIVTYFALSPPGDRIRALYPLVTILLVTSITWVGIRLIDLFSAVAGRRYRDKVDSYEDEALRVRYTRISVGRHALIFLAVCIGLGLALYELQVIKNLSLSFLASAGVASVLLGATAHTVLGNTLAGIQIALTKPVSIGDSVNFEGQWGFVEDITYAYLAIRTWDHRRVIVPLSYFISHPFENWSKTNARVIKPIYLYADYHVDVDAVRAKFRELLEQSDQWDQSVGPVLQVTGMTEKTIELRALCSAKDPTTAWALHCQLREDLIAYLQHLNGGRFLPRQRVEWAEQKAGVDVAQTAWRREV